MAICINKCVKAKRGRLTDEFDADAAFQRCQFVQTPN